MNTTFIECTDALMQCLSEHDLAALQTLYAQRLVEADREKATHQQGVHDTLTTRWRLLRDISDALVQEQARRLQQS